MKKNQLFERLWEHGRTLRRVGLVLVMCLITITQAWGDDRGFWDKDAGYVRLYRNNAYEYGCTVNKNGTSDFSIGNIDSDDGLYWTDAYAKVWGGTDIFNSITFHWRVKGENAGEGPSFSDYNLNWHDNMGGNTNQFWNVTSQQQYCSISGLAAGYYEVEFYFSGAGKDGKTYYANNNGGNYHANFTLRRKITYHTDGSTAGTAPSTEWWDGAATVRDNTGLLRRSDGYVFAGWATSSGASTVEYEPGTSSMSVTLTADLDLYPVWKKGSYFISLTGASTNGVKNTTDFIASQSLTNTATEVNGVTFSKSYYKTSAGQASIKGQYSNANRFIVYDTKSTSTTIRVYVKNTDTSSKTFYYYLAKEGSTSETDQSVSLLAGEAKVVNIDASNSKGTRVILCDGKYDKIFITQIIAIESGTTLPLPGQTGYELAFPGRVADHFPNINGIEITGQADNLKWNSGNELRLQSGSNKYLKFTTTAATQLQVKNASGSGFYVCTDKSNPSTTGFLTSGSTAGTKNIYLDAANTYYIMGENSSNTKIQKVSFAAHSACTAPTGLAAGTITYKGATFTVTDGTNANNYEFYVSTSSTAPTASTTPTYTSTSKTKEVTDLNKNTTYYAWVRTNGGYFHKSAWTALTGTSFKTLNAYDITYDCDGAESGCPATGSGLTLPNPLPDAPFKPGYNFDGWFTNSGKTTPAVAGAAIAANTPLYAKWTKVYASGTYNFYNNATLGTLPNQKTITTEYADYNAFRIDNIFFSAINMAYEGGSTATGSDYKGWKIKKNNATIKFFVENDSEVTISVGSANTLNVSYTNTAGSSQTPTISSGNSATYTVKGGTMVTLTMSTGSTITIKQIAISSAASCITNPTVTAGSNSAVTTTTATVSCASGISSLGSAGCSITSYGFVIGTSANPAIGGSGVTQHQVGTSYASTGTSFSKNLTGLTAGTTYYVRPYATNGNGTAYGTETYFTTSTVTMTPTLTNVTHTSGATSSIGGSDYTAVFTANTGYSMPNPTVTIGGNAATIVTDYTWSVEGAVGTITIPANKINGNIVITLNSAAAAPSSVAISGGLLYFAGETISLTATPTGGNGPVTYQWYKGGTADGNAIEGATNATYTKASCAFEDAGSYYCKVTCGGSQSTWGQSGNAYDVKIPRLYVKTGHFYDPVKIDYGNVDFTRAAVSTATASIVLGSNGEYCFNINDGCGHYYGNTGTMQYNNYGPWTTNVIDTLCGLTTTNAGTYIFTINYSDWSQLTTTITFPSCTDPGLAFASASKSVTLCDDAPTNALTNTHGVTVSYTSSDETVATVASDGTLTIKKAGTTTITASSLEQTVSAVTYCADNASYTLTVNASTAAGLAYGTATVKKDVGDDAFTNTLTNSNSLSVTYSSSDEDVATVASDGTVTIKAAGTTIITASSAQQKVSSTCYAAGSATYTLTVYPVYTVSYNAMGGTCGTESANTVAGEVTLPTPTHASYSFDGWYTTAGVKAGNAGAKYSPSGKITLYAKWSGSCAGGGGSGTTVSIFDGAVDETNAKSSDRYDPDHKEYYTNATTGFQYKTLGIKDALLDIAYASFADRGSYSHAIQMNGSGGSNYIELKMPTGYTAVLYVAYAGYGSTNQKFGVNTSAATPNGSNCDTWNATASSSNTVYTASINLAANTTYYLAGGGSSCYFAEVKVTLTPAGATPCYTVTYDGNGATSGYTNDPVQYAKDAEPIVLDCGYEKTGYAFIGWAEGTTHRDAGTVDYQPGGHITSISDDVTLYAIWKQIKYFKGTSSSSWNTSSNWSPSGVPAITDPVVIQANVTVDTDEAKALSVDIESGNTLTINAGQALIIEKTLTKAGSATAASDVIINSTRAAGVGALIIGGETGTNKATVNFATKVKRESGTGNWINQFIGSPFSDLEPYVDYALQIYAFKADGSGNRGYWHSLSEGNEMEEFVGHNILYNDNNFLDVQWTGTLNASSNEKTLTGYYGPNTYSLFANSWVAPIHIGSFESDDFENMDATIYIFNAGTPQQEASMASGSGTETDAGTYAVVPINSSSWLDGTLEVIPAMQAFFVNANAASPSLILDYTKLVYTPAVEDEVGITPTRAPRRATAEEAPEVIRLRVAGENGWAETTYLLGREDFTEGFDNGWDGRYMEGEDTNPQLYAPTSDGNMAVNCVPQIEGTVLGFRKGNADSQYTFSFEYAGEEEYYLKDLKLDIETRIDNESTYAFTAEAGDNAARFIIVRKTPAVATGVDNVDGDGAKVRKLIINDKVYIIRGGRIYSVDGALVK